MFFIVYTLCVGVVVVVRIQTFSFQSELEKQMISHRENHQRQLSGLRDEIEAQKALIDQLKE